MRLFVRLIGAGIAAWLILAIAPGQGIGLASGTAQGEFSKMLDRLRASANGLEKDIKYAKKANLDVELSRSQVDLSLGRLYTEHADMLASLAKDLPRARFWADLAAYTLHEGVLLLTPSRAVETRGILIDGDAIPKDPAAVAALVDRLAGAHFNLVLPEVIRRGYAIYPSRVLVRDPSFASAPDVLKELIQDSHRHGMEVHPWIWTFRVRSYDAKADFGNPVLSRLPGLAARSYSTKRPRFLSPAEPGARRLVLSEVQELVHNYDIDGLMLDYIRYDEQTPDDWASRTDFALSIGNPDTREAFFGIRDLDHPKTKAEAELVHQYQLWRESQVNLTVQEVHKLLERTGRRLAFSAAVFRGESSSRHSKLQNWRYWADRGWLSFAAQMLYSAQVSDISLWIDQETDDGARPTLVFPILGVHAMDDPRADLLEQIRAVRQKGQGGILLFSLSHLPLGLVDELALGPFRAKAMPSHRAPLQAALAEIRDLRRYLNRQRASGDWGNIGAARSIEQNLSAIERLWPSASGPAAHVAVENDLLQAAAATPLMSRANPEFALEVARRLRYAAALVRADGLRVGKSGHRPDLAGPSRSVPRTLQE